MMLADDENEEEEGQMGIDTDHPIQHSASYQLYYFLDFLFWQGNYSNGYELIGEWCVFKAGFRVEWAAGTSSGERIRREVAKGSNGIPLSECAVHDPLTSVIWVKILDLDAIHIF